MTMTIRRWMAWLLLASLAGCATAKGNLGDRPDLAALPGDVVLQLVDDNPPNALDQRQRVTGPDDERLLLFPGRSIAAGDVDGIVAIPGWRQYQLQGRYGARTFEPGQYVELHALLRPHAWGQLTAVRQAFERVAVVRDNRIVAVLSAVAVLEDQLVLASPSPGRQLAWLGAWDAGSRQGRDLDAYLTWLQRRHQADPSDAELLTLFAEEALLSPIKDCQRAESAVEALARRAPEDDQTRTLLHEVVNCHAAREDADGVIRSAQRILELQPALGNAMGLRAQMADAYWSRGDADRAIDEMIAYVEFLKRSDLPDKADRIQEAVMRIATMRQHTATPDSQPPES